MRMRWQYRPDARCQVRIKQSFVGAVGKITGRSPAGQPEPRPCQQFAISSPERGAGKGSSGDEMPIGGVLSLRISSRWWKIQIQHPRSRLGRSAAIETKKDLCSEPARLPKTIRCPTSTCLTHVKLLFVSFPFKKKRSVYKKGLVLESVLRNMINAPTGLSQDVAQWLVLIKRLQVSSGFWLHCGENKWGVCDASYVTMKEPTVRELQGMSPHVLHLSGARSRAIYHIHKYSEITLRIMHADTRLWADALPVRSILGGVRSSRWLSHSGHF